MAHMLRLYGSNAHYRGRNKTDVSHINVCWRLSYGKHFHGTLVTDLEYEGAKLFLRHLRRKMKLSCDIEIRSPNQLCRSE